MSQSANRRQQNNSLAVSLRVAVSIALTNLVSEAERRAGFSLPAGELQAALYRGVLDSLRLLKRMEDE